MKVMWIIYWTVFCLLFIDEGWTSPEPQHIVGIGSPECSLNGGYLNCDYKDSTKDAVFLNSSSQGDIKKIFLYNVKKLHLDECIGVDLWLQNIEEVILIENQSNCSSFELSAKDSYLDKIPKYINKLYLETCKVDSIDLKTELSKFTLISSTVGSLTLVKPLMNKTVAVIQSSNITHLRKFVVDADSTLKLQKSSVKNIGPAGLRITGGTVIIKESKIESPVVGVTIVNGGSLKMENVQGDLTLTSLSDKYKSDGCRERERSEWPTGTNEQTKLFIVLFSVCFALLLLSWTAFVAYLFKDKIFEIKARLGKGLISVSQKDDDKIFPAVDGQPTGMLKMDALGMADEESGEATPTKENYFNENERLKRINELRGEATSEYKTAKVGYQEWSEEYGPIEKVKNNTFVRRNEFLKSLRKVENKYLDVLNDFLVIYPNASPRNDQDPLGLVYSNAKSSIEKILEEFTSLSNLKKENELENTSNESGKSYGNLYKEIPKDIKDSYGELYKNCNETFLARRHIADNIKEEILQFPIEVVKCQIEEKEKLIKFLEKTIPSKLESLIGV